MKNYIMALSNLCLAVSVVIGSWLISNSLNNPNANNPLLSQTEVADYLGISEKEVEKLSSSSFEDGSRFPVISIDDLNYYPKKAIDKWLLNVETTVIPK